MRFRALLEVPANILTYQTAQTIVLMSYERYVAICQPFTYKTKFTSEYRRKCYSVMVIALFFIMITIIADIILSTYFLHRSFDEYVRHFKRMKLLKKVSFQKINIWYQVGLSLYTPQQFDDNS